MTGQVSYDEFGLFDQNAAEYGLPFDRPPVVRRAFAGVAPGRRLSALVWQQADPELVLLHGGSQNAHTWDTVAMAAFNPARSRSSLRRGILHNAEQQPDGTWVWRWARHRRPAAPASPDLASPDLASPETGTRYDSLWEALARVTVPVLLARGMRADSVLDDADERELRSRLPSAQIVHVTDAGHSLQGDTPLELAAIIEAFVFGPASL